MGRYHGAASWRSVSPGYFDVFQIRLLRGRAFTAADDENAAPVVLINRAMLRRFWQEIDANPVEPIGQHRIPRAETPRVSEAAEH